MRVLVIGGTGFIGQHVVARLVRAGYAVHVTTRRYQTGRDLLVFPALSLFEADIHNDDDLQQRLTEVDAVINLVGVLHSHRGEPWGSEFQRAHVDLPRRLAALCKKTGVRRLIHLSALGAHPQAPSAYLRSKAAGEAALVADFADWHDGALTLFRPSVVFGPEDHFMNKFAALAKWLPVIPLAGAHSRMQPIYVRDVATAIVNALEDSVTFGKTYPLAGVSQYTLAELVGLAARWSGNPRPVWPMPWWVGYMQAAIFEILPGQPIMSRDNVDSLRVDSVTDAPIAAELNIRPTPLESVAPRYLDGGTPDKGPAI